MSVRYEWMADPSVELIRAGEEVGGDTAEADVLALSADSVTVIDGNLVAFAVRVAKQTPGLGSIVEYKVAHAPAGSGGSSQPVLNEVPCVSLEEAKRYIATAVADGADPAHYKIRRRVVWQVTNGWHDVRPQGRQRG